MVSEVSQRVQENWDYRKNRPVTGNKDLPNALFGLYTNQGTISKVCERITLKKKVGEIVNLGDNRYIWETWHN